LVTSASLLWQNEQASLRLNIMASLTELMIAHLQTWRWSEERRRHDGEPQAECRRCRPHTATVTIRL